MINPPYDDENVIWPLSNGTKIKTSTKRAVVTPTNLLRSMDDNSIDKALVMATSICSNTHLSEIVKNYSDRLIGFAWVDDPKDSDKAVVQLDEAILQLGLSGLKLHPDMQNFSPADPLIIPLIERAAELGIPVLIHSCPGIMGRGYFSHNLPENVDTLKKHVPEATIIIAHMGYSRYLDLLTIGQIPGVYIETSWGLTTITDLHGMGFMSKFIRRVGVDNFLYGSDWVGPHGEMERQLGIIEKLDLNTEEKDKILGENIREVMNL